MAAVLLVENDAPIVRLMAWYLIDAGFEVMKAEDPRAAASYVRARPTSVIVFNTGIPAHERADWIRRWHEESPNCRVLDVLASVEARLTTDIGADASIQLPFEADAFVGLVHALFDDANRRAAGPRSDPEHTEN